MESTEYSPFDSFKSKKMLNSSSKQSPSPSDQNTIPAHLDKNPWSSKTPEKPIKPPRRIRNRGAVLSLKEVREAAQKLRKSEAGPPARPDALITSAKEQIPLWPESSPSKLKKSDSSQKLPEKYEILEKFFSSLDSSIRLLRMKGSATSFANISPKIECLTDRYANLIPEKLKFIFPEAIEVKKILIHDERTNCMKPDLHLALNATAIEAIGKEESECGNVQLRKIFRTRLLDFLKAHPEGDEIPEEVLPEPFNQSKKNLQTNSPRTSDSSFASQTPTVAPSDQKLSTASHLSSSFRRRFSQQVPDHKGGDTNQEEIVAFGHAASLPVSGPCLGQRNPKNKNCVSADTSVKFSSNPASRAECSSNEPSLAKLPISPPPATPVKDAASCKSVDSSSNGTAAANRTPAPPASTPARLMSATPGLRESKRCYMSPNDDLTQSPNKLVRRPSRSRSLKFDTPVKGAKTEDDVKDSECLSVDKDILDILPQNLIQSIREKERKALLEQDPAISQAKWRQQMIAGLPKLFDMIYFLFHSIRRSVITKEELMHKIVSSHLDIVDRREVEEQLRLLQELVPEWIYEKSASSGDQLLCVNKISSPELIRTRLAEAK